MPGGRRAFFTAWAVVAGLLLVLSLVWLVLPQALEYWAQEAMLNGATDRALHTYALLTRWYPTRPEAGLYELQQADIHYYKYGDIPAAWTHYRAALATGKLSPGLDAYTREQLTLIKLYSGDTVFFLRYVAVADVFRRGNSAGYQEAAALARALLADGPPPGLAGETWFLLAESHRHLQEYPEALAAYRQVVAVYSHHRLEADALYGAAYSAEQVGEYEEAFRHYERLAESYPDTLLGEVGGYSSALLLATQLQEQAEARRRFESYLSRYPSGVFAEEARDYIKRLG